MVVSFVGIPSYNVVVSIVLELGEESGEVC